VSRSAIFLSPGADLAAAVDLARRADAAGYESVWVTHGLGRDGLHVLAAYAHAVRARYRVASARFRAGVAARAKSPLR